MYVTVKTEGEVRKVVAHGRVRSESLSVEVLAKLLREPMFVANFCLVRN